MGILVNKTDFTGKYTIAINSSNGANVDSYIALYETELILNLLGVNLGKDFIANCEANAGQFKPTAAAYLALYNAIQVDLTTQEISFPLFTHGRQLISSGMKNMILGLLYFYIVKDQPDIPTTDGFTRNAPQVGVSKEFDFTSFRERYNQAINDYKAIQYYIRLNIATYSVDGLLFNGVDKVFSHWATG